MPFWVWVQSSLNQRGMQSFYLIPLNCTSQRGKRIHSCCSQKWKGVWLDPEHKCRSLEGWSRTTWAAKIHMWSPNARMKIFWAPSSADSGVSQPWSVSWLPNLVSWEDIASKGSRARRTQATQISEATQRDQRPEPFLDLPVVSGSAWGSFKILKDERREMQQKWTWVSCQPHWWKLRWFVWFQ